MEKINSLINYMKEFLIEKIDYYIMDNELDSLKEEESETVHTRYDKYFNKNSKFRFY